MSLFASSSRVTLEGVPGYIPFSTLENERDVPAASRIKTRRPRKSRASRANASTSGAAAAASSSEGDTPQPRTAFQVDHDDSASSHDEIFNDVDAFPFGESDKQRLLDKLKGLDRQDAVRTAAQPPDDGLARVMLDMLSISKDRAPPEADSDEEMLDQDNEQREPYSLPSNERVNHLMRWPVPNLDVSADMDEQLDKLVRDKAEQSGELWTFLKPAHGQRRAVSAYTGQGPFSKANKKKSRSKDPFRFRRDAETTDAQLTVHTEVNSDSDYESEDEGHPMRVARSKELSARLDQLLARMALKIARTPVPPIDRWEEAKRPKDQEKPPLRWTDVIDAVKELPGVPEEVIAAMTERLGDMFDLPKEDLPPPGPYQPPTLQTKAMDQVLERAATELASVEATKQRHTRNPTSRRARETDQLTTILWPTGTTTNAMARARRARKRAIASAPASRRASSREPSDVDASPARTTSRARSVPLKRKASQTAGPSEAKRQQSASTSTVPVHGRVRARPNRLTGGTTEFKSAEWITDSDVSD